MIITSKLGFQNYGSFSSKKVLSAIIEVGYEIEENLYRGLHYISLINLNIIDIGVPKGDLYVKCPLPAFNGHLPDNWMR